MSKQTNKKVGQGEEEILNLEIHIPFNSTNATDPQHLHNYNSLGKKRMFKI